MTLHIDLRVYVEDGRLCIKVIEVSPDGDRVPVAFDSISREELKDFLGIE